MDGLLIDSEILWHKAELEIFGDLGVPISDTGDRSTKGMFVGEVVEYWFERFPWSGPSRSTVTTSSRLGPDQGKRSNQYSTTSPTNIPLVERSPVSEIGTPRSPKISSSALCQRISESIKSPSMSNRVARNVTTQLWHTPHSLR